MENILQWNCNGISAKYDELRRLLGETSPFCIALQETHLRPSDNFSLRGYNIFRKDVIPNQRAHGGVATFLKDNLPEQEMYSNRTTITRPMAVRLHETLSDLDTSLPRIQTVVPRDIPPRSQVKLLEVKDNVYPWPFHLNMKRREQVVIARLRMGHTNITSMHLLRGESPPLCPTCQETITTKHILLDCPQYEHYRMQLNLPNNIRCCLSSMESTKNVLKFTQLTNMFNKI
nr:unnamed protein product [Callosobruchus chinensis]